MAAYEKRFYSLPQRPGKAIAALISPADERCNVESMRRRLAIITIVLTLGLSALALSRVLTSPPGTADADGALPSAAIAAFAPLYIGVPLGLLAATCLAAGCATDGMGSQYGRYDWNRPDPAYGGYYADRYYRDDARYRERRLSRRDRIYRGSDGRYYCRRSDGTTGLIVGGMWVQAAGLLLTAMTGQYHAWLVASVLLGLGTAMVYPSLIAAVSDASHPSWRARSLSVYRFWRDLGYAIGALSAGLIADYFGFRWAIIAIAGLTFASGLIVAAVMRETRVE